MRAIATLLTLMLLVAAGPARSQWYFRCDAIRLSVPGLSGDAWRILLDRDWSARDRADPTRFDAERAIRQASLAPLDTDYPDDMVRFENYQPSRSATDEERDAYDSARQLYLRHDWKAAVAGFDAIVEAKSPFAAAAAYTAARAALYDAEFADGFQRIERIVGDPALREMHQAAHHLIGTLANQTGGSPLIAARLGEILHLVTVPLEPRCRSAELHALSDEAADDLSIMLGHAFPHSYRDFDEKWSSHTRGVIQRLAAVEPMLDMIRILAAATPYRGDHWIEPFFSERLSTPGFSIDSQHVLSGVDIDPVEFTSHARTRLVDRT